MIKVLVLTAYFYPTTGGVAMHTYNLYSRIASDNDFKINVVTSGDDKSLEEVNGMNVMRLPFWFKLSNTPVNLGWYFEIKKIIEGFGPDIVVSHTPVPFMSDIGAIASGEIPFIVKYHHAGSMTKGKFINDLVVGLYEKTFSKFLLGKARTIISASDFTARNFLKDYKNKTITITPGVDINRFKPVDFVDQNRIFFLGSLNKAERYKGLEFLIQAMPLVKKEIPNSKLIVVSPGDFQYFYENLAKENNVFDDVLFLGKLLGEKLVEELQKSSVVVLPSVYDSCPNILLEAMACAKPIVGSNVSGIPDLVSDGENGLLVDPRNPEDIAKKIVKILGDKELANKLGKNGLERVRKNFTWDSKAEATKELFKKALQLS